MIVVGTKAEEARGEEVVGGAGAEGPDTEVVVEELEVEGIMVDHLPGPILMLMMTRMETLTWIVLVDQRSLTDSKKSFVITN